MDIFTTYLKSFFAIGSKEQVQKNRRVLLENMVSCLPHTLTSPQKIQARKNIGLDLMFKVGQKVTLTKGTHDVYFAPKMTDNYIIFATGSTSLASVAVVIVDDSQLDHFTIKVAADCDVRWRADLITEFKAPDI